MGVTSTKNSFLKKNSGNFRSYMPSSNVIGSEITSLSMNLQLLVRFETSLKLNIIDHNGDSMIPYEDKHNKEFHYLQFECTTDDYELDWGLIKKIFGNFRNP
jgi:hypothetical protein